MRVELTVNGGLLQGKLTMSNTQRHEWETAKDAARRVRAWVRRYVAEMGYSAPADDTAIDTACHAANGVITVSALPITGNGNGRPQSTRKAATSKPRKPSRKAARHAQGVLGRDTEEGGTMAGVWEYAPEYAASAEAVRYTRKIHREYAAMLARAKEYERKAAIYGRLAARASAEATVYGVQNAVISPSSRPCARKCGRVAARAYAAEIERKRARDTELAALIAEQTAAIAAKDTATLADISAKIAAIVAA